MIVSLIGEPATGKTTLTKAVMKHFGSFDLIKFKLLRFMKNDEHRLVVLGIYTEHGTFDGTDKLSMAVQKDTITFCHKFLTKYPDYNIFFEGDRIGNRSFLDALTVHNLDFKLFVLETTEETKHKRHESRLDSQSDQFKKAKRTKISKLKESFIHTALQNDTEKQYNNNLQTIIGALSGKTKD